MTRNWHILSVVPPTFDRWAEFHVRDELHAMELEALVPVELEWRRLKATKRIKRRPIAVGYCFAKIGPHDDLSKIKGLRGVLKINGHWATLKQHEVNALEILSRPPIEAAGGKFLPQQIVKIRLNAMADLKAVVQRCEGGKVHMLAELFGKSWPVIRPEGEVEAA